MKLHYNNQTLHNTIKVNLSFGFCPWKFQEPLVKQNMTAETPSHPETGGLKLQDPSYQTKQKALYVLPIWMKFRKIIEWQYFWYIYKVAIDTIYTSTIYSKKAGKWQIPTEYEEKNVFQEFIIITICLKFHSQYHRIGPYQHNYNGFSKNIQTIKVITLKSYKI